MADVVTLDTDLGGFVDAPYSRGGTFALRIDVLPSGVSVYIDNVLIGATLAQNLANGFFLRDLRIQGNFTNNNPKIQRLAISTPEPAATPLFWTRFDDSYEVP